VAAPTATAILVDSREPTSIRGLRFGGVPVAIQALACGDVHVLTSDGALLALERKTPSDLINSTLDGRLFAQAGALRALSPFAYLVVDGAVFRGRAGQVVHASRDTGFSWSAWEGALLTVQELGVAVLHVPGDAFGGAFGSDFGAAFEDAVLQLVRRQRGPVRPARRVLADDDPALTILTSLPGIGYDRALALLRTCGSVAYALWAATEMAPTAWTNSPEGRAAVGGIGPKRKALVRAALGLAENEVLRPITEADAFTDAVPVAAPSRDAPHISADPAREEAPSWTPSTS
jgi:ERCC4-type nuclease